MSSTHTVRIIALEVAGASEPTTRGQPTFRGGETILAALHDDLLILRGQRETQAARLAGDRRLQPAPHRGRDSWIAIALAELADEELPDLLSDAHQLAGAAR